ncbi:magnesium transporter [Mastigocoleus sp. MO_188.B34]|uniref:magnesium transporter n=1 Tax=Mastigocoleus sp. MO_188.B34 TaxID=3036635 RepID=UPI00260DD59E|nr:magnesium transporter [Mastigocoleus sp. MO_188.B34]MDJ0693759.1 magnesium transporter [Mastigocoleus sp. MO_188.B34]
MNDTNNTTSSIDLSRQELRDLVRAQLQMLLEAGDLAGAKAILVPVQPADIAEAVEGLPEAMHALAFRLLSKDEAIEVYEYLDYSIQERLISELRSQEVRDVVDRMSPDDRAKLFDELPAKVVNRLLEQLSLAEREATAQLLGYEAGTAGRIMTPELISLKEHLTVEQTLERIRQLADSSEIIYYLYVTDNALHLSGIVSLRELVISHPNKPIGEIMTREVVFVNTDTDQEEVARLIQRYDFLAVPVVDREKRLVGIVTVDDVIDILQAENTEDIYAVGGGVQSSGDNYFQINLLKVARKRVVWLLVLLVTNTVTGAIITAEEDVLAKVVKLAAFIPLLTGTGGNVGAQSSTVVIRGMNTGELRSFGALQVVGREALAGALLGGMLGVIATFWAVMLQKDLAVAIVVGCSLLAISILASVSGSALPFLFRLLRLDPALMSAPFITTAVDVAGVLIYFNLARLILNI